MIYAILLLAFGVRLISVNQSLWLDEATTALVARDYSWDFLFNNFLPVDFHPPLYYLVVKLFSGIIGNYSEIVLRAPSVVFGVATIYLAYKICLSIASKNSAFIAKLAVLLLATAPLHIYYSQEARMYAMAAFLVTLSVFAYLKEKHTLFTLSLSAAFWTDYMTVFIVPVFVLDTLLDRRLGFINIFSIMPNFQRWLGRRIAMKDVHTMNKDGVGIKPAIVSLFVVLALCLPMLDFLPDQLGLGARATTTPWASVLGETSIKNLALIPVKFIIGRISFEDKIMYGAIVLTAGLLLGVPIIKTIKQIGKLKLIWLWLVFPIIVACIVGLLIPVVSYFRFIFVLPALYILAAVGMSHVKKYRHLLAFALISANILFSSIYLFNPEFHREDWRGFTDFLKAHANQPYKVVFVADSQIEAMKYYSLESNISGPEGASADLEEIWLMRYVWDIFDPEDRVVEKVESLGFSQVSQYNFNGVVVWKYENRN